MAEITSFIVSGMGVSATQFIPINIGGSVAIGTVLGVLLLGETVMLHGWSGVILLIGGIALVATDPGEKVVEGDTSEEESEAPPLYVWIGPALFCALSYALYNICIKKGSAYINPVSGRPVVPMHGSEPSSYKHSFSTTSLDCRGCNSAIRRRPTRYSPFGCPLCGKRRSAILYVRRSAMGCLGWGSCWSC